MNNDDLRICYIGTLSKWQGVYQAIRALEQLESANFLLHILSPSKGRREFEKWLEKRSISEKVSFLEPLDKPQLRNFLSQQDVGLAPLIPCERNLIQGCMPIKILDYMAAGLTVVASDIPVSRHLLGDNGVYYQPYSTTSLGQSFERLFAERSNNSARLNLKRVKDRFSGQQQSAALFNLYQQFL